MTDLTRGKRRGLRCMADESGIFKVTVVDERRLTMGPIAAHHGVAQAPILRGSWGLR